MQDIVHQSMLKSHQKCPHVRSKYHATHNPKLTVPTPCPRHISCCVWRGTRVCSWLFQQQVSNNQSPKNGVFSAQVSWSPSPLRSSHPVLFAEANHTWTFGFLGKSELKHHQKTPKWSFPLKFLLKSFSWRQLYSYLVCGKCRKTDAPPPDLTKPDVWHFYLDLRFSEPAVSFVDTSKRCYNLQKSATSYMHLD